MNLYLKTIVSYLGLILLFLTQIQAQSDSVLIQKLRENSYAISIEKNGLGDSGASFLNQKAADAHYFLIGEQHGVAEIPSYTAQILKAIDTLGYKHYASEIGPITARIIANHTSNLKAEEGIEKLLKEFPSGIPFYALKNEAEVIETFKTKTELINHFWGLDQEFILSSRLLLMELVNISKTETEKNLAKEYYNRALVGYQQSVEKKVPMVFLFTATDQDFEKLEQTFSNTNEAIQIIREMQKSQEIYIKLMIQRKGYQSNQQRASLLKQHFLNNYKQFNLDSNGEKVLIKLGAVHTYKGINPLGVSDIGNFIHEFATSKEQKSFHLYILPAKGQQNVYTLMSRSETDKNKAFDNSNDPAYAALIKASMGETRVFDLTPLRSLIFNKQIVNIDEALKRIIFGYDAILILPQVTAATLYD